MQHSGDEKARTGGGGGGDGWGEEEGPPTLGNKVASMHMPQLAGGDRLSALMGIENKANLQRAKRYRYASRVWR